jgi:hypothetical protein
MFLALLMGGAMARSLAQDHGWRRVAPIAVVVTLCHGLVIGWALTGEFNLISITGRSGG